MKLMAISRRNLLAVAGSGVLVAACSENPATGRRQFMLISDADLAALGQEAWRDALQRLPRVNDLAMQRRLARIGESVAQVSSTRANDWEFVVFDSPEINAFVLPGGKVGFFRGLMEQANSDHEIAAVMGHEVGACRGAPRCRADEPASSFAGGRLHSFSGAVGRIRSKRRHHRWRPWRRGALRRHPAVLAHARVRGR